MKNIRFTTDELNRKVMAAIDQFQPTTERRMTKEIISIRVYGRYDPSTDRSVRDAVTELVISGHPICATSDKPGYYLARSYAEAEKCIAELQSRSDIFTQKIDGIKRGLVIQKNTQPDRGNLPVGDSVQMSLI